MEHSFPPLSGGPQGLVVLIHCGFAASLPKFDLVLERALLFVFDLECSDSFIIFLPALFISSTATYFDPKENTVR